MHPALLLPPVYNLVEILHLSLLDLEPLAELLLPVLQHSNLAVVVVLNALLLAHLFHSLVLSLF
jgi:hypothetical protein